MGSYLVNINMEKKIVEYMLPAINNRRLEINLYQETGYQDFILNFEIWDGCWHILSNSYVELSYQKQKIEDHEIIGGDIIQGMVKTGGNFAIIIIELNEIINTYKKYSIESQDCILIGRKKEAQIIINEGHVGGHHATIVRKSDGVYLSNFSSNGTYLNQSRIFEEVKLNVFDVIYIIGYKIIYLGNVIAINRLDSVNIKLPEFHKSELDSEIVCIDYSLFSRSPRKIETLDTQKIEIEMPPSTKKQRKTPLIFVLGPSLTMPLPIAASILFNLSANQSSGRNITSYLGTFISIGMFSVIGVGWAIAHYVYNNKISTKEELSRIVAYKSYLSKNEKLLIQKHTHNRKILELMYLSAEALIDLVENDKTFLWNRNINHEDFLNVRVGIGKENSSFDIIISKSRFTVENDPLAEEPYNLYKKYQYMDQSVKKIKLKEHKIIGVIGNNQKISNVVRNILVQISCLHSYTDVKIAFLTKEDVELETFNWVKWLPHTFSSDKKTRFVSNDERSCQTVLYELLNELRNRSDILKENKNAEFSEQYIIFCTKKTILDNSMIYNYMTSEDNYGFTFVLIYSSIAQLPNECKMIIECSEDYSGYYRLDQSRDITNSVMFDQLSFRKADYFARMISGIYVNEFSTGEIPLAVNYLELLNISDIKQWDLLKHYKESRAFESLKALIGVTTGNKPMFLDIHEKKHGPHGLIAGTTGSGKSEMIQTYILSLILNFHPSEIAFILIDYKGGGMANIFFDIPHLAGIITNLDVENSEESRNVYTNSRRALISIKSEIKQRQIIFRQNHVNHIDSYMRLYREGAAKEAMPHLIIISDEFAELNKEEPDFIKELVSIARIGRSLGVHLILATQKPDNVISDDIRSNSRFKICLRVQDKQDSIGMLNRPEAAYLTTTGRAYFQIGNDEIFEMFQSGYSGGQYEAKDKLVLSQDNEVIMIEIDGTPSAIKNIQKKDDHSDSQKKDDHPDTQLQACIKYIIETTKEEKIEYVKPLWLSELPYHITLNKILELYPNIKKVGLTAVFGLVDQPELQRQFPAVIDFSQGSHLLIAGSAGCGKTTMVQTILVSLVTQYTSDDFIFYCLDFSSRTLKVFNQLPQCGSVIFSDESEAVNQLFVLLLDKMQERKDLFSSKDVGSFVEYKKICKDNLPEIIMVIDNYFEFSEFYQDLEEELLKLLRDGAKYGIQLIVTVNHQSDIKYRLNRNFSRKIPLTLTEKGDYMEILNTLPDFLPIKKPGRGLLHSDGIMEFQAAFPVCGNSEKERMDELKRVFAKISGNKSSEKQQLTIPKNEDYKTFIKKHYKSYLNTGLFPMGYSIKDISVMAINLSDIYCYAISSEAGRDIDNIMHKMIYTCSELSNKVYYIDFSESNGMNEYTKYCEGTCNNDDELIALFIFIKSEFQKRSAKRKDFLSKDEEQNIPELICKEFSRIVVFIRNMKEFSNYIYTYKEKNLYEFVEAILKNGSQLGINFIGGFEGRKDNYLFYETIKLFLQDRNGIHFGKSYMEDIIGVKLNLSKADAHRKLDYSIAYCWSQDNVKPVYIPNSSE